MKNLMKSLFLLVLAGYSLGDNVASGDAGGPVAPGQDLHHVTLPHRSRSSLINDIWDLAAAHCDSWFLLLFGLVSSTMPHNPAVLLVLLFLPTASLAEVSDFTHCPQFFMRGVPPTVPTDTVRFKLICQCLLDQNDMPEYFYATLYDTQNKIPVYSAYQFHHAHVERKDPWYVEPQLDGGTMECMGNLNNILPANRGLHQALNKDYEGYNNIYDKGHLYPVYHTKTERAMLATSTLTNAAPQDSSFNRGPWRDHEQCVAIQLQNSECDESYIVTGVVPGNTYIGKGVTVAKQYWSAYCCVKGEHVVKSAGFLGPNNNGRVAEYTVQMLDIELTKLYAIPFSIFQGACS